MVTIHNAKHKQHNTFNHNDNNYTSYTDLAGNPMNNL